MEKDRVNVFGASLQRANRRGTVGSFHHRVSSVRRDRSDGPANQDVVIDDEDSQSEKVRSHGENCTRTRRPIHPATTTASAPDAA